MALQQRALLIGILLITPSLSAWVHQPACREFIPAGIRVLATRSAGMQGYFSAGQFNP
jgi:hypothetical protein